MLEPRKLENGIKVGLNHKTKQLSIEPSVLLPMRNCRRSGFVVSMKAWKQSPIPWIDRYRLLSLDVFLDMPVTSVVAPTSGQVRSVALMFVRQGLNRCLSIKKSSKMKPNSPTPRSFLAFVNQTINHEYPSVSFSQNRFEGTDWKSNLLGRDMVELLGCYASLPSIFDRFRFQSIVESMSGVEYCRVEHGSFSFSNFQVQDGSAQ